MGIPTFLVLSGASQIVVLESVLRTLSACTCTGRLKLWLMTFLQMVSLLWS